MAGWGAVSSVVLAIFSISVLLEVAISSTAALSSSSIEGTLRSFWARCCLTTFETRELISTGSYFFSGMATVAFLVVFY